jgi:hypothetical protein
MVAGMMGRHHIWHIEGESVSATTCIVKYSRMAQDTEVPAYHMVQKLSS